MLFNSLEFLFFLPIVFALYWLCAGRANLRNLVIVIASYAFYGWWDYRFLALLALSTASSYASGIAIEKCQERKTAKWICAANVVFNLSILAFFKYFNFFGENFARIMDTLGWHTDWVMLDILLPVGISFYTFQAIGYTIDVYRRSTEASHNPITFAAFISFFPQLVAGPIERAGTMIHQFSGKVRFSQKFYDGMRQMLWGFFKKMVIADNCAVFVDMVWDKYDVLNGSTMLLAAVFFTFQIYGDFSGYSDIAIGTGKLFGIDLSTNFKTPYFATNIGDFWRRWHISLMSWFRDYIYIPLGGSRVSKIITARNILLVFALSGLWHGANWTFVTWGIYHAILLIAYSLFISKIKLPKSAITSVIGALLTFAAATIGWIIFRSADINEAWGIISKIFSASLFDYVTTNKEHYLVYIAIMLVVEWVYRKREHALSISGTGLLKYKVARWAVYYLIVVVIILLAGPNGTFIYFQF
ncbi:MAG: MBOAT family O-acyltransferase [Muribaculaceae bacterium]|nr:MBOAT family O-acyltransferase [Muribaculaceae bacterium]